VGKVIQEVDEYLQIIEDKGKKYACKKCGYVLCDIVQNYKDYALKRISPITEIPDSLGPKVYGLEQDYEFRQYFCPECKILFKSETALKGDPLLQDAFFDL